MHHNFLPAQESSADWDPTKALFAQLNSRGVTMRSSLLLQGLERKQEMEMMNLDHLSRKSEPFTGIDMLL
jgi:hypothetical protein